MTTVILMASATVVSASVSVSTVPLASVCPSTLWRWTVPSSDAQTPITYSRVHPAEPGPTA